jgi:hypothetical protein
MNKRQKIVAAAILAGTATATVTALAAERMAYPALLCVSATGTPMDYMPAWARPNQNNDYIICPILTTNSSMNVSDVDAYTAGVGNFDIGINVADQNGDYVGYYAPTTSPDGAGEHHDWGTVDVPSTAVASLLLVMGTSDYIYSYSVNDSAVTY